MELKFVYTLDEACTQPVDGIDITQNTLTYTFLDVNGYVENIDIL